MQLTFPFSRDGRAQVLKKVRRFVEGREREVEGVPVKLVAYISYVDLLVVARGTSRQWSVYLLRDFPAPRWGRAGPRGCG